MKPPKTGTGKKVGAQPTPPGGRAWQRLQQFEEARGLKPKATTPSETVKKKAEKKRGKKR